MKIRSVYPTRRLQDRILLFCMFFGIKIHSAIVTLLSGSLEGTAKVGNNASLPLRIVYACITLLYCSYIKFMYRINSIWLAGLFITLSITYTGLYTKELVDIATEAFHPYTIIAGVFCFLYQLAENYLLFKNEYLKLKHGQFPFIEKYHLYVLYFFLGTSWNSIKTVALYLYEQYPIVACLLLPDFVLNGVMLVINTNILYLKTILIIFSIIAMVQTATLIGIIFTLLGSTRISDRYALVMTSLWIELFSLIVIFICLVVEIRKYLCVDRGQSKIDIVGQ